MMDSGREIFTYAIVDAAPGHVGLAKVVGVHRDRRDAGDAELAQLMAERAAGRAWVSVSVGDDWATSGEVVEVFENGDAVLAGRFVGGERVNGCEVIASTKYVSRKGLLDTRIILVRRMDDEGFVTAIHCRDESGVSMGGWGRGNYFELSEFGEALEDYFNRARKLLGETDR